MAAAPSSGGLFFSSSPTQGIGGLAEEVELIVRQAQKADRIDPALEAGIYQNPGAFFETFRRRIEVIKSRSQAFQDCHVTVFDKALLIITDNGAHLKGAPAINYFCEEFLGVSVCSDPVQKTSALTNAFQFVAQVAPNQVLSARETQRGSISNNSTHKTMSPERKRIPKETLEEQKPALHAALAAKVDPSTARLWTVYQRAKDDYFAIDNPISVEKQEAAKFLRDTAENVLHTIRHLNPDRRLIDELELTFSAAKHTAMTLHGGKDRKFDDVPLSGYHNRGPALRYAPYDTHDSTRADRRSLTRPRALEARRSNGFPDDETRALARRPRTSFVDAGKSRQHFAVPDLSPEDTRESRRSKKPIGRGHSGIPFGYTRSVDSYCPSHGP